MDTVENGEKSSSGMSGNVDLVTSILQEVQSPEIEKGDGVKELMDNIGEKINSVPDLTRREFLSKLKNIAIMGGIGATLAACGVKPEDLNAVVKEGESTQPPSTVPTEIQLEGTEREYAERGYTLVENPFKLDTTKFIMGESGYRTAIAERFPFAPIDESGKTYSLKYGRGGEEVTYLHYTGTKPPVTGEILPLIYRLPGKVRSLEVAPYAISNPANTPKEILITDTDECYLVPIVTSGSGTGIVPNTHAGNLVNTSYPSFKIIPDSISQNDNGFLSWALLEKQGEEIVMVGVVNNMGKEKIFVNYKNVPKEISNLYE